MCLTKPISKCNPCDVGLLTSLVETATHHIENQLRLSKNCALAQSWQCLPGLLTQYEPRHDKTNKVSVRPAKTQISLGIRPVWWKSSLAAWRNLGSSATPWVHSEDSNQTGWMPRLIWVFAWCIVTLLVLSCHGSYIELGEPYLWLYCMVVYTH